jgi:hypothetical protein
MFRKAMALVLGGVVVLPGGCDPWKACDYLDVVGPYLPPDVLEVLQEICSMPHIM